MRNVAIVGAGMTAFGEHFDLGIKDLIPMAYAECVANVDKGISKSEVQAVWFGELTTTDGSPAAILADTLDLTRSTGRQHLAFGHGPHHCAGASLARMELQVALGALLSRLPDIGLACEPGSVEWKTGLLFRGPENLPVAW